MVPSRPASSAWRQGYRSRSTMPEPASRACAIFSKPRRWVKLDIGLVRGVDADPARQALVAGLVHFARQASIGLIAEGIETEAEHEMLKSLGVELGQGFLLARPAPIDDLMISALLRSDDAVERST